MIDKILDKIIDRTPLLIVIIGALIFVFGATGYLPVGSQGIQVGDDRWRLGLGAVGVVMVLMGLAFVWRETQGTKGRAMTQSAYLLCGLNKLTRTGGNFQDFVIKRPGGNINAVYYLWADTYKACMINAYVDNNDHFLRVAFNNKPGSYASNLAIRPYAEQALENTYPKAYLSFEARIPPDQSDPSLLKEVSIGVRVVNGWLQHWEYSDKPGEYIQFAVEGNAWRKIQVELNSAHWSLFQGDGNLHHGPANPEFKILSAVVLEVGSYNVPGRPGPGAGILDIRQVKLEEIT
jgi:hypothetical protein